MKKIILMFAVACTATSCQTSSSSAQSNSTSLRKSTVLTISPTPAMLVSKENVNTLFVEVLKREEEKHNPASWIDDDIVGWFKNQTMPAIDKPFESAIYRFNNDVTHRSILDEAEKKGVKKIYTYTEALKIVLQGVMSGEVDKKGTGIIAYLKVDGDDQLYRFNAWRYGDGQLLVDVYEVSLGYECGAGSGACFSNN